jgi:hypothetical protein
MIGDFLSEISIIHEHFAAGGEPVILILAPPQSGTRSAVSVVFCHPGRPTYVYIILLTCTVQCKSCSYFYYLTKIVLIYKHILLLLFHEIHVHVFNV